MEELFGKKQSLVSSYSKMLKVKQQPGQSTRIFLFNIFICCQKLFYKKTAIEHESCLLMSFINGLLNPEGKNVLEKLKPKTINEAYSLIETFSNENTKNLSWP